MEMLPWQLAEIGGFFSSLLQLKFISSNNFFLSVITVITIKMLFFCLV